MIRALSGDAAAALTKTAGDVMTRDIETCTPEDPETDIMERMNAKGMRHLPVLAGGKLTGIVSRSARILGLPIDDTGAMRIAQELKQAFLVSLGQRVVGRLLRDTGRLQLLKQRPGRTVELGCELGDGRHGHG